MFNMIDIMALSQPPAEDPLCADAEADTFFCFSALMSHVRDAFVKGWVRTPRSVVFVGLSLQQAS